MKKKWKIVLGVVLGLVLLAGILGAVAYSKRGIVTVQTGKVRRADLRSVVTASGEVKPRNYINIGANAQGPIIALFVKEGDHVRKGQVLATLEHGQPAADVEAQSAALNSAAADAAAFQAAIKADQDNIAVAQAQVEHDKADLEQKQIDYHRAKQLLDEKLLSSQDFDTKKAALQMAQTTLLESERKVAQAEAMVAQASAQFNSADKKIAQSKAMVARSRNILADYQAVAPINGVVTNLPVRVGETVVPGIQNSAASTIMTIADMSVITAEVDVDEADIVSIKLGQPAEVTIDAIPNRTFKGSVIEIGDTAIVRSTGLAASQVQTSSQEAKDFKVKIGLDIPEGLVKPGLSCTAKITTAVRKNALSIPLQALTVRDKSQLQPASKNKQPQLQQVSDNAGNSAADEEQGVFVIRNGKAVFQPVQTGITGTTDIEVLGGLKEGEEIVTGSYQVIRTIKNDSKIEIDNKPKEQPATT